MVCHISPFLFLYVSDFVFLDGWSDNTSNLETAINSDEHRKINGLIRKMIGRIIYCEKMVIRRSDSTVNSLSTGSREVTAADTERF